MRRRVHQCTVILVGMADRRTHSRPPRLDRQTPVPPSHSLMGARRSEPLISDWTILLAENSRDTSAGPHQLDVTVTVLQNTRHAMDGSEGLASASRPITEDVGVRSRHHGVSRPSRACRAMATRGLLKFKTASRGKSEHGNTTIVVGLNKAATLRFTLRRASRCNFAADDLGGNPGIGRTQSPLRNCHCARQPSNSIR